VTKAMLAVMAHSGVKVYEYYSAPGTGFWATGLNYYDLTDGRGEGIKYWNGKVRKYSNMPSTVGDKEILNVLTDPVTYPHTVGALSDASGLATIDAGAITRTVIDGDTNLFSIADNNIVMNNNGGLNFLSENNKTILIKSVSGEFVTYAGIPIYIGNPGYLNLTTAAYHKAHWFDKGSVVDANSGSPDGVTFNVHKSSSAFGGVHIVRPFENVIAAAGTFTLHFLGRTKPNTPNIRMTIDGSGFFPVGSTSIITDACTYSSPTIAISDTSSPFSVTFTNASGSNKNVSGADDFVLRIFFNTSNTSDIEGVIGNLYFTFG
jgi:hypothetical protein